VKRLLEDRTFAVTTVAIVAGLFIGVALTRAKDDPAAALRAATAARPSIAQLARHRLVESSDIDAAGGALSPGAAVLRWWQDVQFRAPEATIAGHYAAGAATTKTLDKELKVMLYMFDARKPVVVDTNTQGGRARVFTVVVDTTGAPPSPTSQLPVYFDVTRTARGWRLANDDFLHARTAAELEYEHK
jgi:hypothetical protein